MSLDSLCKEFNKSAKADITQIGMVERTFETIPLSSPRANYCLHGGVPTGRIIEFFGDAGSGKTTTTLDVIANYQKMEDSKKVLFLDAENTYDPVWAEKNGVDTSTIYFVKPEAQCAEELFDFVIKAIDTGEVGLVIIDSLGVLLSQQAYEKSIADRTYGGIAMALTVFSKKAEQLCKKHDCTLIGINQVRDNLNSMFGGTTTTGGHGWKHACSLRVQFKRGDFFDSQGKKVNQTFENPAGNMVNIAVVKSKCFPNDRKTGFYRLHYYEGILAIEDTVDLAIRYGFVVQSGAWFSIIDPTTGEQIEKVQGMARVVDYLKENDSFYTTLLSAIEEKSNEQ